MRRLAHASALLIALTAAGSLRADEPAPDVQALESTYQTKIAPLFERYCFRCHGPEKQKAELNLSEVRGITDVLKSRKTWEALAENVEVGLMPPEGDLPTEEEIAEVLAWVASALESGVGNCEIIEPGRVTMRRLNRAEYDNTVRDLLGFDSNLSRNFPRDDVGYGFDNIGDVLMLPPLLMEKYFDAAEELAERAIVVPSPDPGQTMSVTGRGLAGGEEYDDTARRLNSAGETFVPFHAPKSGRYRLVVRASAEQAGDEPARMALQIDGRKACEFEVTATPGNSGTYETLVTLRKGMHKVAVVFLNDYYEPNAPDPSRRDRNLIVESLSAVGPEGPPSWPWRKLRARDLDGGGRGRSRRTLGSDGEITAKVLFPSAGRYRFETLAFADQAGPEPARMGLKLDGRDVAAFDVLAETDNEPGSHYASATVPAGEHVVSLTFLNDYFRGDDAPEAERGDRNLHVVGLNIASTKPFDLPESHRRLIARTPKGTASWAAAARESLGPFLTRAYRRPATDEEINRLVDLVELARRDGEPFERGMQLAVTAALVNPNFLYRVEADPSASATVRELSDFELASRLSYFLWTSMPDEELFRLASEGTLSNPEILEAQTLRLLADPRSSALVTNFADQWLTLRRLQDSSPDPRRFKGFDNTLRAAMQRETEMFFESILREDRSILDLIDADYTFVNGPLAELYGIEGVEGEEFRRVDLSPDSPRGGILTQASVLTVTSNPTRTSPVKRGKWILEQILGTPPPPPPPDVPELEEGRRATGTLRERLEQHRANPMCATCHAKMDPLGFGFENFDGIGRWRDEDRGDPIDASGTLPGGESFQGAEDLKAYLISARSDQFARNFAEKLLTYALGRGLTPADSCSVDAIAVATAKDGRKISRFIVAVVRSDPFRKSGPDQTTSLARNQEGDR